MKTGGGPSIGSQVIGELKGVAQDLGKGIADIPKQIIEGPNKQNIGNQESQTDHEGKALESGQQIGDDSQVKQQSSGQGFGDALKSQFGMKPRQLAQKQLAQVRRNLEQEIKIERQKKEQQEVQKKQTEEKQEDYVKEQTKEQKRVSKQSRIMQMLSMGKGERRGTKGK